MWRVLAVFSLAVAMLTISYGYNLAADVHASTPSAAPSASPSAPPSPSPTATPDLTPSPPAPTPAPTPKPRSFASLASAIDAVNSGSGAQLSVSLIELGGTSPAAWNLDGKLVQDAASTYKLPALMAEAAAVAAGGVDPNGLVCYQDSDYEDGWFDDYADGSCYSRNELAQRAGLYSDNTAGHMLVRDLGGSDALNSYAASLGATSSSFFDGNTTTANDLAALMDAEVRGASGGAAAQAWLYQYLAHSKYEAGIPAGVPAAVQVIHKTGQNDYVTADVAFVNGPNGGYVLAVMAGGLSGDDGWQLIAAVSAAVSGYEAAR